MGNKASWDGERGKRKCNLATSVFSSFKSWLFQQCRKLKCFDNIRGRATASKTIEENVMENF
jgi:hypothetical protein